MRCMNLIGCGLPAIGRRARGLAKWWAMPGLLCCAAIAQTNSGVTITGGPDGSGQNYEWTVTNNAAHPIVDVTFPHYNADTFLSPGDSTPSNELDDWTEECTNLQQVGATQPDGVCRAFVSDSERGILPGRNAKFGMRIARVAAEKGLGNVVVKLSDGTQITVAGVTLPVAPSVGQKYGMTIIMGGALTIFIVAQAARRRRAREKAARAAQSGGEGASPAS